MKVKMILPALTEAKSPYFRPITYSLFPPLGLASLAGYLPGDSEIEIQDEHVETLNLEDEPDLVVIQVYITSARRAYQIADHYRRQGAYVCLGGLHVTSLPEEAAAHADSIFLGPGEDIWPAFLTDFRAGPPRSRYQSTTRTLTGLPPARAGHRPRARGPRGGAPTPGPTGGGGVGKTTRRARCRKGRRQARTDETGAPRDQNLHGPTTSMRWN